MLHPKQVERGRTSAFGSCGDIPSGINSDRKLQLLARASVVFPDIVDALGPTKSFRHNVVLPVHYAGAVDIISPGCAECLFPGDMIPRRCFGAATRPLNTFMASTPSARLSQVSRQFSNTGSARSEIQDAYILAAARTPTAKV